VTAEDEFSATFERHYHDVERFILRRAADLPVADLVSEVFLVAWRRWSEVPRGRVLPWLYATARYVLANEVRSRQRHRRLAERLARAEVPAIQADHADELADRVMVAEAFDRLGEADREVLRLVVWERLRVVDAARVLGCSAPAFAMRLARARRRFRDALAAGSRPRAHPPPLPRPALPCPEPAVAPHVST
jgi:RNA polymerase sigma-70 factor (ECF subfamily)